MQNAPRAASNIDDPLTGLNPDFFQLGVGIRRQISDLPLEALLLASAAPKQVKIRFGQIKALIKKWRQLITHGQPVVICKVRTLISSLPAAFPVIGVFGRRLHSCASRPFNPLLEGSKGSDLCPAPAGPRMSAHCAFETFEATPRIQVHRTFVAEFIPRESHCAIWMGACLRPEELRTSRSRAVHGPISARRNARDSVRLRRRRRSLGQRHVGLPEVGCAPRRPR